MRRERSSRCVRSAPSDPWPHPGGAALPDGIDRRTRYDQNFRIFCALGALLPLIGSFDTALTRPKNITASLTRNFRFRVIFARFFPICTLATIAVNLQVRD